MREISFVQKLKFNFNGSVTKKALVIGDADNDQHNELVCANLQGELAIFKGRDPNKYAYATDLGMVTACVIGDIINTGANYVAAINTEGWLFIFNVATPSSPVDRESPILTKNLGTLKESSSKGNLSSQSSVKLDVLYDQRMPANCKELLLADLDGDGQNEVIVGLTDRVLRTYKWIKIGSDRGKFVGLYKWEFADQIGAVSLNPSRHENCQDIIVAQPGGTYAKLECFDKKSTIVSNSTSISSADPNHSAVTPSVPTDDSQKNSIIVGSPNNSDDNVRTEYISKLTPEYHQLALAQMRNHHISTEVLGGIRDYKDSYSLIVIATLDGTLMLVNKDEILWSLQVDHQLFALAILEPERKCQRSHMTQSESTCTIVPNPKLDNDSPERIRGTKLMEHRGPQYFVACAWNGKTYIIDEERNYLRFKFDEAVSAFTAGNYYFDGREHASLVYANFNNQIILYHDVILDQIRPMYLLDEVLNNPVNGELLNQLETLAAKLGIFHVSPNKTNNDDTGNDAGRQADSEYELKIHDLLQDVLNSVKSDELVDDC